MSVKKIITSGCSFTEIRFKDTWPCVLKSKLPDIDFDFLGLESSGNEIIQKRATLAVTEALEKYKPEEILVIVMWSTHDRKTFYLDYHQAENLIEHWKQDTSTFNVAAQFADLKTQFKNPLVIEKGGDNPMRMRTSLSDGWFSMHNSHNTPFSTLYYNEIHNLTAGINTTLENVLFLNMFCEKQNVRVVNTFIMASQIELILSSNHQINKHLAQEFLKLKLIPCIYDYLKSFNDDELFRPDNQHPNWEGHIKYVDNVMIPYVNKTFPDLLPA